MCYFYSFHKCIFKGHVLRILVTPSIFLFKNCTFFLGGGRFRIISNIRGAHGTHWLFSANWAGWSMQTHRCSSDVGYSGHPEVLSRLQDITEGYLGEHVVQRLKLCPTCLTLDSLSAPEYLLIKF